MPMQVRRAMMALALVVFGVTLAGCASSGGHTARTAGRSDPSVPLVALVAGTVFEEAAGVGIEGAVVKLGDSECATDRYGCFSFGKVELPGEFTITFSAEYYSTVSSTLDTTAISRRNGWEYWFAVGLARGPSTTQASASVVLLKSSW